MAMDEYEKQANSFLESTGTKVKIGTPTYGKHPAWDKDDDSRWIFPVTFSRTVDGKRIRFSVKYGQSIAQGSNPPTKYDLLTCLTKGDPGSFENFCGDYGYDPDSRKAERIYNAVCKEWVNVDRMWPDAIDQLREIV